MTEERLQASDAKVLLLWILVGLVGAGVAFKYFFQAFPEASVDFRVSRPEAVEVARNFLAGQGHRLEGYLSSIVFGVDDDAKTYLEREVGLAQANRLMAGEVSVWHWAVRFFRPGQKEEFRVRVSPAGRLVGTTHILEEAHEGAQLSREAARTTAEEFLRTPYRADLTAYDFLPEEANSTERPRRRDWSFTWERRGFRAPPQPDGAPYRLKVTVHGDQADECVEYLKVPEAWKRDYDRLRSSNIFYEYIALVPYALLHGALLWSLFEFGRRGLIRWRGALKLGLVLAVLFFAMYANEWPLSRASYDTNSSYAGFLVGRMLLALLSGLGLGLLVSLTVAGGEPLYRRNQPEQLRLGAAFSLPGIRSREFFRSCVIGVAMAAAHIGFVVLFYLVGKRFGIWAPQELDYTDVVSTAIPWIFPLTIGVYAATSEEFLFRLFAIPLLLRFTRSRFLAVVVPAFVWGFLHSSYPQEPGYIRGVEVGVIGIVAGWVMLRWGILATLVWHYTVDALLISLFLLRSGSLYFRVSGAVVGAGALIPLAIAGAFYLRRRGFAAAEPLLNRAEPLVETAAPTGAAAAEPAYTGYEALSSRRLGMVLGSGVVGVLLLAGGKPDAIGDFVRFRINARQATARADEVLRRWKIDAASYKRAATLVDNFDGYTNEYLLRQVGIVGANGIYKEKVPSVFWRVRYFRDSQKEEYAVILRPDGALHSVHHLLEEKAPGRTLTKEEAQARAEAYLGEEKKLELAKWKLAEARSEKHPARSDHTFTWEELEPIGAGPPAEAAHVRIELKVQGDEVSGYRVFIKLPEAWQLRQTRRTLASIIYLAGRITFFVALGMAALVIFFMNLKQRAAAEVPWRRLARWSLWGLLAILILQANHVSLILSFYRTDFPFRTYVAILLISTFLLAAFAYSCLFFSFGLAWFFLSRVFGEERLPAWRGMPATYYRDAFYIALGGSGVLLGFWRLAHFLGRVWPTAHKTLETALPTGLVDSYLPAAQAIAQSVGGLPMGGLFVIGYVALAAGFIAGYVRQRWMRLGLVLVAAVALAGEWGSPADFAKRVLVQLLFLVLVWQGVTRIVRFNLLAYFLVTASIALVGAAGVLLQQPNAFLRANGFAVVAALLMLLAWPLLAWLRAPALPAEPGVRPGPAA